MDESFGEQVVPTDAIRDILRGYPFSVGLFREILQNSDDARATKQTFVLDRRQHPSDLIHHSHLASTQGPALLAFNDGVLQEKDWNALRNIHRSSKTRDNTKIGKFGLGFRSCYHITDVPHILSGQYLAILDPQHHFREDGGVRINLIENFERVVDHLTAFESILPHDQWGKYYDGSIFRFPLRTSPSDISRETTSADDIGKLLRNFVLEELDISLLFLRSISAVEVFEVGADGEEILLGKATIDRTKFESYGPNHETRKVTIRSSSASSSEQEEWRIIHASFSEDEAAQLLSDRLQWHQTRTERTFEEEKLSPTIDLAIPCDFSTEFDNGRLFTFLPLPLKTSFPVHINGLFSLTQSRQNLRNADEVGIVGDSEDRARVEWNRLLFDTYIPQAWAILLEVLVRQDRISNIFYAWPKAQASVYSGDSAYWRDIPVHVAKHALELDVWPISGTNPPSYQRISSLIVEERSVNLEGVVVALVRTGVQITRLPQYLTAIITKTFMNNIKVLSPPVAYMKLQSYIHRLQTLDDEDAHTILAYLLSTSECHYIVGLPLVPSVSSQRITLKYISKNNPSKSHVLLDQTEEVLFAEYDPDAISLARMAPSARDVLVDCGSTSLNVIQLKVTRMRGYLERSSFTSPSWGAVSDSQMKWLNLFWQWAKQKDYARYVNPFYLVPTTKCTRRSLDTVFDPGDEPEITPLLEALGLYVIDPRFEETARESLSELEYSSNILSLLDAIQPSALRLVELSDTEASTMCTYLLNHIPGACDFDTPVPAHRLRALPIYPVLSVSDNGSLVPYRTSISPSVNVRGLNPYEIPIFPRLENLVLLDLSSISHQVLQYINPNYTIPLSNAEMHELMLNDFPAQTADMQVAFIQYISEPTKFIPRSIINRLSGISFIPSRSGKLQAPNSLIHPNSSLAVLFPGPTSYLPSTSHPTDATLVDLLCYLELFRTQLTPQIVKKRIQYISTPHSLEPESISRALISHLNDAHFDLHHISKSLLSPDSKWIPTHSGFRSPLECRDSFSHQGKTDLFDEAMPLVEDGVHIGPLLRSIFGWNGPISDEVLLKQLVAVVSHDSASYSKVYDVVKELGQRIASLTESQITSLRQSLHLKKWVPTRSGTLETVTYALLGAEEIPEIDFHCVAFDVFRHTEVRTFLGAMGCVEKPTKDDILNHLQHLRDHQFFRSIKHLTMGIIQLLGWLPRLAPEDRVKVSVPDDTGYLCHYEDIYFNDVGDRAALHDIGSGSIAHPCISPALASDLGLQRLGLMGFQEQSDLNLEINLVATIRTRLGDYNDSRLIPDLLYVASESGATEVNILLDEASGATDALLSPRCQELQRSPALVVQYNSMFTEKSLREMLQPCYSGKSSRKPFIGHYGFGLLSVFHITEFATIISGGQVWFINPCKAYLSIDNTILRLPLSVVQKSYGDHLSSLLGLFGFSLTRDPNQEQSYNGTILRLPLRSSTQSSDIDPVFMKTTSLTNLVSDLKTFVAKAFLFTALNTIQLYDRKPRKHQQQEVPGLRLKWSVEATRKDFAQPRPDVSVHIVTIRKPESLDPEQNWRIISLETSKQYFPPNLATLLKSYRPRTPNFVRAATRLDSVPESKHNLFYDLPFAITIDLPVHISAPCILTSDASSVWLEDQGPGPEATYNQWLMTAVIPVLYLRLLEDRAFVSDNAAYWPGSSKVEAEDASSDISTLVGDAVYQMALAENSTYKVFRSKFDDQIHPPRTARFVTRLPRTILEVLDETRPNDLIYFPHTTIRRLQSQKSRHFSVVNPKYLHKQLSIHPIQFSSSNFRLAQVQELIDFLTKDPDSFNCLVGLQLLPLEDGSFATFGLASSTPCYYAAPSKIVEASLFSPARLVHHSIDVTDLLSIDRLNVKLIADNSIKALMEDSISPSDSLENADHWKQQWIRSFWGVFSSLKVPINIIAKYPLIPTLKAGHYLSLAYCKNSAILADFSKDDGLRQSLAQMGLTVVNTAVLPAELQKVLPPAVLTVEKVLSKIIGRDSLEIASMFNALDSKTRPYFMGWIRRDWQKRRRAYFNRHEGYRALPIWRANNGSFISANEAQMLPKSVTIQDMGPFASGIVVGHDLLLVEMGLQPPPSIQSLLEIPPHLASDQDQAYRSLLQNVLLEFTSENASIPVPNSHRDMRDSSSLYSSRDDLFTAAFGPRSERDTKEMRQRADILFWYWGEELPARITLLNQDQLRTLDDFRFIARHPNPRPFGSKDDKRFMPNLPPIVSPNELVRAEYQPIAWTQRALYKPNAQPHSDLLKMHKDLSVPTAEEVVKHLVALATKVAYEKDKSCQTILIDHLEQTYEWLNKNAKAAEPFLQKCKADQFALFLNTEVPQLTPMEAWNWKRAEHILLNSEFDREYLQYPRVFIKPYRSLLSAAGAVSMDHGQEIKRSVELPANEDRYTSLCSTLNRMRRNGICTDVEFTFKSSDKKPLHAHRTYLAAYSNYFMQLFSKPDLTKTKSTTIAVDRAYSRRCVELLLDYAYTSQEPELKGEDPNYVMLAIEILSLANLWEMKDAQRVMQSMIISRKMVDPFTLGAIRDAAQNTESDELLSHCSDFAERNAALIQRVKEEGVAK
ncbi:Sacsin [Leucoagaricus sp. SymC.cos]|nr:Sacsin [Leucoagaricus sp. SymC.cos]